MSIRRWTKIFTLGDRYTDGIFEGPISITEKVDGSQFNFGISPKDGLTFLTKGSTCHVGDGNKLFAPAMDHISKNVRCLIEGWSYHGETLASPRHNTLQYDRVPKGHIALYGITKADGTQVSDHKTLKSYADELGIDVVPELFSGTWSDNPEHPPLIDFIMGFMDRESYLGKEKIEGVVIKNYGKEIFVGGRLLPLMQAKFVSEKFKERHGVAWPQNNKGPLTVIGEMVRTQARWDKAIQRIKEDGTIQYHPRDIGAVLKNLHTDLETEDKELIKEKLWNAFSKELKRSATRGFPEAYKVWLVEQQQNPDAKIRLDITGNDFREVVGV